MSKRIIHVDPNKLNRVGCWCDYDYESDNSGCQCPDYCRCGRIVNAKVKGIDIEKILDTLFAYTIENKDELLKYCFHRILTHGGGVKPENWEVNICSGYYGQEVDGIRLSTDVAESIVQSLTKLLEIKKDVDRIMFVLEHEYGYILDSLKNATDCHIKEVITYDIVIPQQEHYRRLNKDVVAAYKDYSLPICVCLETDGKYKLIDGYHRMHAHRHNFKNKIIVVE